MPLRSRQDHPLLQARPEKVTKRLWISELQVSRIQAEGLAHPLRPPGHTIQCKFHMSGDDLLGLHGVSWAVEVHFPAHLKIVPRRCVWFWMKKRARHNGNRAMAGRGP